MRNKPGFKSLLSYAEEVCAGCTEHKMHPNVSDEGAAAALHITAKEALFELSEVSQFYMVFLH